MPTVLPPDDPPGRTHNEEPFHPLAFLLGAVLMVPNRHWGFEGVTSDDHPGACPHVAKDLRTGTLVKGTDADHVRHRRDHLVVEPTPENGLLKPTGFELVPRPFRMHRLRTYFPQRKLGVLNGPDLVALRTELERLHPEG